MEYQYSIKTLISILTDVCYLSYFCIFALEKYLIKTILCDVNCKYGIYDTILKSLNDYQIRKLQFMKIEFEKCMKYCDYAEEQCVVQEKLLLSILQMNKYSNELNIIIETIIMEPIQKHNYCISTDTIIAYPSFEYIITLLFDPNNIKYCAFDDILFNTTDLDDFYLKFQYLLQDK